MVIMKDESTWWLSLALCRSYDPELWFEHYPVQARRICKQCPVKTECLEDALSLPIGKDKYGIRGGLTPRARRRLRESRRVNDSVVN